MATWGSGCFIHRFSFYSHKISISKLVQKCYWPLSLISPLIFVILFFMFHNWLSWIMLMLQNRPWWRLVSHELFVELCSGHDGYVGAFLQIFKHALKCFIAPLLMSEILIIWLTFSSTLIDYSAFLTKTWKYSCVNQSDCFVCYRDLCKTFAINKTSELIAHEIWSEL